MKVRMKTIRIIKEYPDMFLVVLVLSVSSVIMPKLFIIKMDSMQINLKLVAVVLRVL